MNSKLARFHNFDKFKLTLNSFNQAQPLLDLAEFGGCGENRLYLPRVIEIWKALFPVSLGIASDAIPIHTMNST